MRRHLVFVIALPAVALAFAAPASADSWLFKPSTFSHHPTTGARVIQYAPKRPAYARVDPTYLESGYRHMRFGIRAGGSADRFHVVQTWGAGEAIRPYGEWLFPFRAGATPFGPWGNPRGPWTTPFGSWINPYGLGQLRHPPWPHWSYPSPALPLSPPPGSPPSPPPGSPPTPPPSPPPGP